MLLALAPALLQLPGFSSVTDACGFDIRGGELVVSFGDYDGDGDPDLLVDGRRLFRNDSEPGEPRFVEVTAEAGLEASHGPGACWFDFDLDGRLDLGTRSGEVWIQDDEGHFHDFSARLGVTLPTGSASAIAWGDLDGDGWLDLFSGGNNTYDPLTHYAQSVWLNTARKKPLWKLSGRALERLDPLRDATAELGVEAEAYGRAVVLCDFDWDGDEDVYSGNYHLKPNFLYRNDGGALSEVADTYGVAGKADAEMFTIPGTEQKVGYRHGHTIGAAWADFTGDGYFDLWVSNLVHKYAGPAGENFKKSTGNDFDVRGYLCDDSGLYVNEGPPSYHFREEREERGIPRRPIGARGVFNGDELWSNAVCADVDNDGWIDVFCNQIYGDLDYSFGVLYRNRSGTFSEEHEAAGVSIWGGYGAAFADLDSDGWMDLVVCGTDEPGVESRVHVFLNKGGDSPWLGLDIQPERGEQVVGAKVLLVQEEGVQLRQLTTTTGSHTQQCDGRVHFGLGEGGAPRDVLVYWPDGQIQSLGPLKPGRYHSVSRRSLRKKRCVLEAPPTVTAGEPFELEVTDMGKHISYAWDWEGTLFPERTGDSPTLHVQLDTPGTHVVRVRATRLGRQAWEARAAIEVE